MARSNRYVVLYWMHGLQPSFDQIEEAQQYGPHVMFRNALFHTVGSGMEPCTAVAGIVPEDYRVKYPIAVSYTDWLAGKLPTPEAVPRPGDIALGTSGLPLAARIMDPRAPRQRRPRSNADESYQDGGQPLAGMTGLESSDSLPQAPPSPVMGKSTTGPLILPPPPPPPASSPPPPPPPE